MSCSKANSKACDEGEESLIINMPKGMERSRRIRPDDGLADLITLSFTKAVSIECATEKTAFDTGDCSRKERETADCIQDIKENKH